MGNMDAVTMNQAALEVLRTGDFYGAQKLFIRNARKNPCLLSLNNLGVFYLYERMTTKTGVVKSAHKLGLRYLLRAKEYQRSYVNLLAIGDCLFEDKDYKTAIEYYNEAYALKATGVVCNNIGASLYAQKNYIQAAAYFEKAYMRKEDFCDPEISDDFERACFSYVFTLLKVDKVKAYEVLKRMLMENTLTMELGRFILAYLCEDMQLAEEQIEDMFASYSVSHNVMAMVFDCLLKLGKNEDAEKYFKYQVERLLEDYEYNKRPEAARVEKAYRQPEFRAKEIFDFVSIPYIVKSCCYIGCKRHNTME